MAPTKLLSPISLGSLTLSNRIAMAPLTRNRASTGNVPTELNATYYQQRASAGLIISEASQISPQGIGYPSTPGIHSENQIAGWKLVTEAVHKAGGHIFLQLWHVGRISHPSLQPNGELPVAPSAIKPEGNAFTYTGLQPFVTPRELRADELPGIIADYVKATENAKSAGFDGVEVHAANGYLLDQFLRSGSNKRTDNYGGSIDNRIRFPLAVVEAVSKVWAPDRVGVRISPTGVFNDMSDSDPRATFSAFVRELNKLPLAYLHLIETMPYDEAAKVTPIPTSIFREIYKGKIIANGGYNPERAEAVLSEGLADMIAFGRLFISNPDLPNRIKLKAALAEADQRSFYGGDAKGYIDYPALQP